MHAQGLAHINGGSYERVDVRPGHISLDHTSRGTLDRAGLSTCIRECGERLFRVMEGSIEQLWSDMREETVWHW